MGVVVPCTVRGDTDGGGNATELGGWMMELMVAVVVAVMATAVVVEVRKGATGREDKRRAQDGTRVDARVGSGVDGGGGRDRV